jgi:hypothetical protein
MYKLALFRYASKKAGFIKRESEKLSKAFSLKPSFIYALPSAFIASK